MKVYDLLNEIIEEVDNSRKSLFGNKKTIDVDFVLEILEEIKAALPDEIVYAQEILDHKREIIDSAQGKAKNILDGVDNRLSELVEEHKVTQLAYEKANRVIDTAQKQAYEIRVNANDYAVNVLEDLSSYMKEYMDIIKENQSNFINKKNKDQAEFE
ncbi:hypothetical protein [Christensenella tenuis]|jgi:vacuolar-type H+-ATPase subunit H|uniref:ATPase n=1 Tax=Christensenella tenuis TaxID=2763033 RepID=A0ABR7EBU7_9FIRM|nr:hypothetical protein [Christensenella tenuis]MBC5647240.1 hypothetical protein [Christensenella tenuis]